MKHIIGSNVCLHCGNKLSGKQKLFCCTSCAASYMNTHRKDMNLRKFKTCKCVKCGEIIEVPVNTASKFALCDKCWFEKHPKRKTRGNKTYVQQYKTCQSCGRLYASTTPWHNYCSDLCCVKDTNMTRKQYIHHKKYIFFCENPKEFNKSFYSPASFKNDILNEQDNCCAICGIKNEWNNAPLVMILDHIDGDASNNKRDNLRCICPNCDTQLPTYKSKNKHSTRYAYFRESVISAAAKNISTT